MNKNGRKHTHGLNVEGELLFILNQVLYIFADRFASLDLARGWQDSRNDDLVRRHGEHR
jgi:hypothetical protein